MPVLRRPSTQIQAAVDRHTNTRNVLGPGAREEDNGVGYVLGAPQPSQRRRRSVSCEVTLAHRPLEHGRDDIPRRHSVDSDHARAVVQRIHLGQPHRAGLGGRVRTHAWHGDGRTEAGYVHDASSAFEAVQRFLLQHLPQLESFAEEDLFQKPAR